ncbi:hypothetical protein PR003_g20177 [Phytophthora rubi]|uniref:Uncharacterized protein n=1 Tax=Phytophthora rubi TaxID=129364 RepID=A0A6A4E178_9STRA|nr:hypothetical protein PR001_g19079 [Phytophthora rubi]KAE9310796.1 hypothetical protein PR003_g20177 [Phytophthora rubi]
MKTVTLRNKTPALPVSEKAVLSWDKTALPVGKMTVMSASQEAPLLLSKLLPDEKTVLLSKWSLDKRVVLSTDKTAARPTQSMMGRARCSQHQLAHHGESVASWG